MMVDVGAPGHQNDSITFQASPFCEGLSKGLVKFPEDEQLLGTEYKLPFVMLADEAFPLKKDLMRPFPGRSLTLHR